MADILIIATAGCSNNQKKDINHDYYPRIDYIELQKFIGSTLLDYNVYNKTPLGKIFRCFETQIRSDIYLTCLGLFKQNHHKLVFNMSERVGIPFSALNSLVPWRKPVISMFTCWSPRQEFAITRLNLFRRMNTIVVKCQSLKNHFLELGVPEEQIHLIPYSVDHHFFHPQEEIAAVDNFIFSVGETRSRNYPLLFRAVECLPVKLLVAASGSWYAREKNKSIKTIVPDNVTMGGHFPLAELRNYYSQSQFVVLPIKSEIYSAGATTILESMSMGKAVIVTHSPGIVDYIKDGETGILVGNGDEIGLRNAIEYLLAHPEEARRMGENGRRWIEDELNIDRYTARIVELIQEKMCE